MSSNGRAPNEEDFFAPTRMSLGDHIEELRGCLWRAVKWFFLALIVGILVAQPVLAFIQAPLVTQLQKIETERRDAAREKLRAEGMGPGAPNEPLPIEFVVRRQDQAGKALQAFPAGEEEMKWVVRVPLDAFFGPIAKFHTYVDPPKLIALSILEGIMAWLKVAMYCGIVLAAPMIFWEIWAFVAAGLYPHEKALVYRSLPLAIGLFLAGVAVCQFLLLPIAIHYLLNFNVWLGLDPQLRLSDWLSFAIFTPLVFGIAFQTPLLMFVLDRVGILSVDLYLRYWRISMFVILVLSAFLAPSPDPLSMMIMATPIWCLYWLGILMCKWWPRPRVDLDVEEPEEAVEV